MPLDLYSASANLGDNLSLTPLLRASPGSRVHLVDDPCVRSIAPVFDGLGEVVFDNPKPPRASPEVDVPGPISRKLLAAHGHPAANPLPQVLLTEAEIAKARAFLTDLLGTDSLRATCVLKCNPAQLNYRTPPQELLKTLVGLNPGVAFINFGLTPKHAKTQAAHLNVEGVREVLDLPIREELACLSLIGRYLGPDTGTYHAMLAVGGRCDVLVPHSVWHYDYARFHYTPDCFAHEPAPRVAYHNWHYALGESVTGLALREVRDPGKSYDELSIALVKATKNPQDGKAQVNFERMCEEMAALVGYGRHNRVVVSPEFSRLRDVNSELYDHTGKTADPARPPQADDQQITNRLNYQRYLAKVALQAAHFGTQLSEQKFGVEKAVEK